MSQEEKQYQLGAVVAKLQVQALSTIEHQYSSIRKVELGAVCGKDGENAAFTKFTPAGGCWMNIDTGAAASQFFKPGKKYYVTFTEAPD